MVWLFFRVMLLKANVTFWVLWWNVLTRVFKVERWPEWAALSGDSPCQCLCIFRLGLVRFPDTISRLFPAGCRFDFRCSRIPVMRDWKWGSRVAASIQHIHVNIISPTSARRLHPSLWSCFPLSSDILTGPEKKIGDVSGFKQIFKDSFTF